MRSLFTALMIAAPFPAAASSCAEAPTPGCVLETAEEAARAIEAAYARDAILVDIARQWIALGAPTRGIATAGEVTQLGTYERDALYALAARTAASRGESGVARALVAEIFADTLRGELAEEVAGLLSGARLPSPVPESPDMPPEYLLEAARRAKAGDMAAAEALLRDAAAEVAASAIPVPICGPVPHHLRELADIAEAQIDLGVDAAITLSMASARLEAWREASRGCHAIDLSRNAQLMDARIASLHIEAGDVPTAELLFADLHASTAIATLRDGAQAAAGSGNLELAQTFADLLLRRIDGIEDERTQGLALADAVAALVAARSEAAAQTYLEETIEAHRTSEGLSVFWRDGLALALGELGRIDAAWDGAMGDFHYQMVAPMRLLPRMVADGQSARVFRDLTAIPQLASRAELLVALSRALTKS